MVTRDPGAPFDTPNVVIGRQGRNELTLSFRPDPYLARLSTRYEYDCSTTIRRYTELRDTGGPKR